MRTGTALSELLFLSIHRASSVLVHHRQLASPQHSALIQISMSSRTDSRR
jgi:hypothetical protein